MGSPRAPPSGAWSNWVVKAGRGFGKTRTGSETVRQWIKEGFRQVNIIVRTKGDIEKILIRSQGGILKTCPPDKRPRWIGNKNLFLWPNGATSFVFTAEEPDALRGPEHEKLWCDELAAWRYDVDAWDMAQFGLRIGSSPQVIITTTPRPTKLIRELIADPNTVLTAAQHTRTGKTFRRVSIAQSLRNTRERGSDGRNSMPKCSTTIPAHSSI